MEFKEVIEKRRTVRDFTKQDVSDDIIQYAIENAFKAPSYNHLREWDFIVLRDAESKLNLIESENLDQEIDIQELEKRFKDEDFILREMYLNAIPRQKKMILDASVVVTVVFKPKTSVDKAKTIYDLNCLASVWCCIENFLLSLAEHNVFGVTYIPQRTEKIKEKLGIPDMLEIAAMIPLGYRAENAKIPVQKAVDIASHIHYKRF
jgi:nitroreductase